MPGFDLSAYETVETRLSRFWETHGQGRVLTDMVFNDGTTFIFRAEIYTDRDDDRPAATGHATETVSNRGVNQTSALENCETSAVGRALADLGFAPKGVRPSREEMQKAARRDEQPAATAQARPQQQAHEQQRPTLDPRAKAWAAAWAAAKALSMSREEFAKDFAQEFGATEKDGTAEQFTTYAQQLQMSLDASKAPA